ncbi:microtubule-associated protein futsch-like isoform X3 [Varroa destructor]|uniref:Spermatogenesis-associated protein 1 C-terminal domain-containing protein n=1 Tax=Varroa destructor TaxID=109461 RepID=A0A7M7J7K1_VARDE|nr:microtubule-associated protein futsch-like isoform X3 [Varroa destructor]
MKPRPISAQLVDLHVYVIPEEDWISHRKLATNAAVVSDAVSAGFIRVLPAMRLDEVREEIHDQLGLDNVPITFIFLRSVGRNFTQVKPHQEGELKVKYFCPPFAAEPELYLKSGDYQEGDSLAQLDFDAAVATSTPLAINSGNNSAADESQESPSPPGSGEEPKVVKGGNRGGGGDSSEQNSLAGKEKETSSSQNRLLPKRNSTAHGSNNDDNQKDNGIHTDSNGANEIRPRSGIRPVEIETNSDAEKQSHSDNRNSNKSGAGDGNSNQQRRESLLTNSTISSYSKEGGDKFGAIATADRNLVGSKSIISSKKIEKGEIGKGKRAINGHIVSQAGHRAVGGTRSLQQATPGGRSKKTCHQNKPSGGNQPSNNQDYKTGRLLPSDEEQETDTFREAFDDVHETSVVDLRTAAGFLNRSAPDLYASGDSCIYLSNKPNNTANSLLVGQSHYGHSLHDLNGQSVASHSQRRSKYLEYGNGEGHVLRTTPNDGGKSSTRQMVIIKRSSRQIRHTSSAVVKATKVSLVDESGKLEDLQYEGENITKCFQPAPKSSPTSLTQNPMSLSIAVSVKEIGDITTQTNGAGEDGSETKLAGAAAGEDIIISHKAAMIGSGHSDEVQPNEISATNHIEENGSALQNNEQDDPGVVNSIIELANGSNVDEADGHVSACNTTSEAVVDTESDKIGTIENAVSDFVEKMVSAIANAIDSAANETDNQNNNEMEPERVTSASENSRHLNNVDKDHDQHAFAEALATVTATAVSTPVDYVAEPQPANEFRNGASAENSQIITASEAPVASVSFSVKDSNAPANLGEESAVESTTEQSDIDGVERDTPSTDLADKGNYESDVTTPGDQMVEVNIETTPESNLVDDDTEDAREEFTGESRPEIESDFISPLSAISERSGSAFQVTEAIANVESEQKKPEEFEYTERQRQHPGDVYDDKSDDQLHEPYEDLDVDNGQPVACTSSTPVVPPSPPVVAQRGSVVGSAHSAPAASSRTASAVIHRSQMSAASKRSSSGVSRWSPTLQKVSRTSSAAAPPRTSRANSATVFPKTSSRAASATSIVPKGASRASSATKQGSRGSSGIARGETFIKESKKDDEEEQQQQLSLGLIKSAKTIIDDSVNNAARTLSASVHSTSLSHEDSKSITTSEDVVTVVEAFPVDGSESRLSGDTMIIEKGEACTKEESASTENVVHPTDVEDAEDTTTEDIPEDGLLFDSQDGDQMTPDSKEEREEIVKAGNDNKESTDPEVLDSNFVKGGDVANDRVYDKGEDEVNAAGISAEETAAPTTHPEHHEPAAIAGAPSDDAESTGLRTPDSKTTTLDDSMSLPNDSGHATEEDRGSSPDFRRSDIGDAVAVVPILHSDTVPSKKSTRSVKRGAKPSTVLPPKAPAPTRTRKSPARTRRNKSPPPPDKYLNRLKRSKSESVALHKLGSSGNGICRVNSRASVNNGEGRLSRLQSKSVAEMEQQRHEEMEKLRAKLDNLRAERRECEAQKEEMVRHVKGLQGKLIQEKETVHDMWKKRYYEEKKITPKLEEESAKLRQELERIHRDLITRVEGRDANDARSSYTRLEEPSNKLSYKIMISGLLQEIEDLKRRLESTKLRLSAEAKLRAMAEKDVRTLREDLIQKKIQVTLTRKETDSVIAPFYRDTIYSLHPMI